MEVHATLRFARIAPRKARLVARAIQGMPWPAAEVRLRLLGPRAAPMILKLLRSAAANARHNFDLDPKKLRVLRVLVNEGPRLKRLMPRARGSSNRIVKRTSHIEVVLGPVVGGVIPKEKSPRPGAQTEVETRKVEELTPDELKATGRQPTKGGLPRDERAVRPTEAPRGIRRLLERKHGEA